jgi:CSLREA domain-containing protein
MSAFARRSSIVVALCALLAFAGSASAKTYTVTKKGDPAPGKCKANDCSLREAITAANKHQGKDTVVLPDKSYELAIETTGEDLNKDGDLDISGPLTVSHPGKGKAKIDGRGVDRIFDVQHAAKSTFKNLSITGGEAFDPNPTPRQPRNLARRGVVPTAEGGGIRNASTIKVVDSSIAKNRSPRYGGAIGVIDNAGLKLVHSTLSRNTAASDGGAIDGDNGKIQILRSKITGNTASGNGGGMYFFSLEKSKIVNSTISGNRATGGGGGGVHMSGGPNGSGSHLDVTGSTISGNRASISGGGLNDAGGLLKASDSTIYGNRAGSFGGGIAGVGGAVKLNAVTVVANKADGAAILQQAAGGGLFYQTPSPGFDVENSLIALNFSGTVRSDCAGTDDFDSLGHNLLSTNSSCTGFDAPSDLVKANPKIGKLAKNGGPTKTVALKKNSPAIGKAKGQSAPPRDQRGHKRDSKPDIGAFER